MSDITMNPINLLETPQLRHASQISIHLNLLQPPNLPPSNYRRQVESRPPLYLLDPIITREGRVLNLIFQNSYWLRNFLHFKKRPVTPHN